MPTVLRDTGEAAGLLYQAHAVIVSSGCGAARTCGRAAAEEAGGFDARDLWEVTYPTVESALPKMESD